LGEDEVRAPDLDSGPAGLSSRDPVTGAVEALVEGGVSPVRADAIDRLPGQLGDGEEIARNQGDPIEEAGASGPSSTASNSARALMKSPVSQARRARSQRASAGFCWAREIPPASDKTAKTVAIKAARAFLMMDL
jgi:hypothetical protein